MKKQLLLSSLFAIVACPYMYGQDIKSGVSKFLDLYKDARNTSLKALDAAMPKAKNPQAKQMLQEADDKLLEAQGYLVDDLLEAFGKDVVDTELKRRVRKTSDDMENTIMQLTDKVNEAIVAVMKRGFRAY